MVIELGDEVDFSRRAIATYGDTGGITSHYDDVY
jgi:hypothetical protein